MTPEPSVQRRAADDSSGERRVPDFFVVGHPKSGTTALYEMLRTHPEIFMPEIKELRFLADDMYLGYPRVATLDDYLACFRPARPNQRAGEASPFYLASSVAARNIASLQPAAKIVAILREPASFIRSLHMQFVETRIENKNELRSAIAAEAARRAGRDLPRATILRPNVLLYSEHVRYVEQLERYRSVFGAEQVQVVIYDDLRADNKSAVQGVLSFLGVDPTYAIEPLEANPTVRVRSQPVHQLLNSVSVGTGRSTRAAKALVKAIASRRVRREALRVAQRRVYAAPRPPDPVLMVELRRRFRGEVQALGEYLDRDLLTLWGYADVG